MRRTLPTGFSEGPHNATPSAAAATAVAVVVSLAGLSLLSGCKGDRETENQPAILVSEAPGSLGRDAFHLELEQTFGGNDSHTMREDLDPEDGAGSQLLLGRIGAVAVSGLGDVYAVDGQGNQLVAFNPDGSVRWVTGRLGSGPGELRYPSKLFLDGDRLVLLNQGGSRFDYYALDGTFLTSSVEAVQAYQPGSPVCFTAGGSLLAETSSADSWQSSFDLYEAPGASARHLFDVEPAIPERMPEVMGRYTWTASCSEKYIFVSDPGSYRISRYTHDGAYDGTFGRSDTGHGSPTTRRGTSGASVMVPSFTMQPVVTLEDGRVLVATQWLENPAQKEEIAAAMLGEGAWPERKYVGTIDLYDAERSLLSVMKAEAPSAFGQVVTSDDLGRVYAVVNEPYPQIRRYGVVVGPTSLVETATME